MIAKSNLGHCLKKFFRGYKFEPRKYFIRDCGVLNEC